MRFYGDRRRQWIGYIMLLLIIGLAALSRNRHRAGSLQGKIDGGNQGYDAHPLANQSAGVYQPPTPSPAASAPHSEPDQIDRHRNRRRLWLILPVCLMLLVAMCAVTVLVQQRQPIGTAVGGDDPDAQALIAINSREADHAIVAERVVTPEAGWLVVYLQRAGAGPDFDAPVGTAQIQRGESRGVRVPLEQSIAAGTPLSAVLHIDAGSPGGFEYPFGPDEPLTIDGNTVTTPFTLENDAGPVSQ